MPLVAPSLQEIERLAQQAVEQLPDIFRQHLGDVRLQVVDLVDEHTARKLGLDSPWQLLGLYHGIPVSDPGRDYTGRLPVTISLYRLPILEEWMRSGVSLSKMVAHVLVHEVGHHFGLTDAQMEAIEREAD